MQSNDYLEQVVQQQARVEGELRSARNKRAMALDMDAVPAPAASPAPGAPQRGMMLPSSPLTDIPVGQAVDYRITGWWWKTVVVPPNVYVVHTRRGHPEPLHLGLGISFGYNPYTDAFLVIPAAVQTLLINARCISVERQGVLVQAYVQWVVEDIRTAYRKLDFSDPTDPMRVVNVQLREQAEAAIKDKVATMPIDAILSDKQPIIEELTHRLRNVAEGTREGTTTTGLGLKIVTVQIKEAVVSSTRLWENLQKPFRAEREKLARMAQLQVEEEIAQKELTNRQARETAEIEASRKLELLRAEQDRENYDRAVNETARRHLMQQEAEQRQLAERAQTEKARRQAEEDLAKQQHELDAQRSRRELEEIQRQLELERSRAELEKLRLGNTIDRDNQSHLAQSAREERDVETFRKRRAVENEMSDALVRSHLIERLPEIAREMPKPEELRAITVGGDGATSLTGILAQVLQLVEGSIPYTQRNGKEE